MRVAEMTAAGRIAFRAYGYRRIAERPELLTHDRDQRLRFALGTHGTCPYSALDATILMQASELDILSAYAVRLLRRPGARTKEILDLLGMLDSDRLLAIYFALPDERRIVMRRDPVWAYKVGHAPEDEILAAMSDWEMLDPEPMSEATCAQAAAAWLGTPASA